MRNAFAAVLAQAFFGLLHSQAFVLGFRLVVHRGRSQLARDGVDGRFEKSDHGGELVGRELLDQLVSVMFFVPHCSQHSTSPDAILSPPSCGPWLRRNPGAEMEKMGTVLQVFGRRATGKSATLTLSGNGGFVLLPVILVPR